ncbi:UPF0481 protein At3g47200-like [Syzygium oleosum]|uniref:UPF0481 protein At3g47200-like n=1 Tax=Syzygium oleosum TaxID=219896 RepID=UPI0011D188E9|nr:UPF0481 protein At3g47200-like [Syzygium oleosum]
MIPSQPPPDLNETDWIVQVNESVRRMPTKSDEGRYWEKRSIYRVPACITDLNRKAYWPQAVSFGPYHHGKDDLLPMEEHKHRALVHFLWRSRKQVEPFLESLREVEQDLKDSYHKLDPKWEESGSEGAAGPFLQLMITDGCFMLEILRSWMLPPQDYPLNDPIFSEQGHFYVLPYIKRDMLMLENQLPMLVLERLVAVESDGEEVSSLAFVVS